MSYSARKVVGWDEKTQRVAVPAPPITRHPCPYLSGRVSSTSPDDERESAAAILGNPGAVEVLDSSAIAPSSNERDALNLPPPPLCAWLAACPLHCQY